MVKSRHGHLDLDASANLFAVSFNSLSSQIRQRMKRDSEFTHGDFAKLRMLDLVLQLTISLDGNIQALKEDPAVHRGPFFLSTRWSSEPDTSYGSGRPPDPRPGF
jgi:hypothetical protein